MTAKCKLSYFNGTGVAEGIRFLLSYGNVEFEDCRFSLEDWPSIKPKMPFGKVPVVEIDGKTLTQSIAICRYLGKKFGLAGKDDFENVQIDMVVETFADIRLEMGYYYWNPDEKAKAAKHDTLFNETLPLYFGKFDSIIKNNGGYCVGGKLTWADLFFVAGLEYLSFIANFDIAEKYENVKILKKNVLAVPQIAAWMAKRPKTDW